MVFEVSQLALNVSTSAGSSIRVEILSPDGNPIEGYRLEDCQKIYGDGIRLLLRFKGSDDFSALAGKPVRLRFVMRDADLYAFQFQKELL